MGQLKRGWRPLRLSDNWLDLSKVFGAKTEAGVVYGARRVEAKCETPAVLRLGRAMGVTVTFNGQRLWSAGSMKVVPDQEHVPITLKPGSNVFLFKLSSRSSRFTAEVTPATGDFGGQVVPIAPE